MHNTVVTFGGGDIVGSANPPSRPSGPRTVRLAQGLGTTLTVGTKTAGRKVFYRNASCTCHIHQGAAPLLVE